MDQVKVLVVDDESNIRTAVRICLEEAGYEVMQACNGIEALEAIQREKPAVVLLDLAMPVMDGMSVLAEIKSLWPSSKTRVIVVTAHGSVKTAIEAVRLGASDFLEKPFIPDELRQSIASVLRSAPAQPAADEESYAVVLERVRQALRDGQFAVAERELMKAGTITAEEPAFLNLAGILHESHGRVESARKFYSRAVERGHSYRPAQQNLERLSEIRRKGRSRLPVAFGRCESTDGQQENKYAKHSYRR